jgi:DNA mismatch endonuclease (patch repair protein)
MTDTLSTARRKELMARIKTKNTGPEMIVRRALHASGYRYQLHRKDLPGTPDIVFPRYRCVVFVHGCFWHGHHACRLAMIPKTRAEFWTTKIETNKTRDAKVQKNLQAAGWRVYIAWQCETKEVGSLVDNITKFLCHTTRT